MKISSILEVSHFLNPFNAGKQQKCFLETLDPKKQSFTLQAKASSIFKWYCGIKQEKYDSLQSSIEE